MKRKRTRGQGQGQGTHAKILAMVLTLGVAFFLFSGEVFTRSNGEAVEWLNRAVTAAHRLNYKGVISFTKSEGAEFSRVEHYVQGDKEYLRTETLNGPWRETIRINDVVRSYLHDSKQMRMMPSALSHIPPGVRQPTVQNTIRTLLKNYTITRAGATKRVAGRSAQVIVFTPKDNSRYEQKFWADLETGLFLAGQTVHPSTHQDIEQFSFVDIEIQAVPREPFLIAWPALSGDWREERTGFDGKKNAVSGWRASSLPPGFSKVAEETRFFSDTPEATIVLVYSDGLVPVSVFVEPVQEGGVSAADGHRGQGVLAAYTRREDSYLITAIGQVPHDTLRLIAQGIVQK